MNRLIILLLLAFCWSCQEQTDPNISAGELMNHVNYLASEELAGRYPGTPGDSMAADYIRSAFENYGLSLLGETGYQYIDIVVEVEIGENNRLMEGRKNYVVGDDFIPLSFTGNGQVEAELVHVGYGLVVNYSDFSYDSYADFDVTGKLVMVLEGGPHVEAGAKDYFSGHISQRNKILAAKDHGAVGVIFVAGPAFDPDDELSFVKKKEPSVGIPAIRMNRKLADDLLTETGMTTTQIEELFASGQGSAMSTSKTISLSTEVVSKEARTHNVLGMIEGPNPDSGPILVIGAHYDHLGMGGIGSSSRVPDTVAVHYGADDNASGVASIIELAGFLTSKKDELDCSVLFIAFAGEEMGLVGSKYFVEHPLIQLDRVKAMINLDMVGRLSTEKKLAIGGVGTAVEFDSIIDVYPDNPFQIAKSPEGYGPSDHAAFYAVDLPVLYLSSGAHVDYHTPADHPEKLNYSGMLEVAQFVADLALELAGDAQLTYQEAGPKQQASARTKFKVTLGIMPDVTSNANDGLGVEFVTEGRPAQRAGIQKGDKIVSMNALPVSNVYDYMTRLQTLEEGQTVVVEVMRAKEKIVLLVQL